MKSTQRKKPTKTTFAKVAFGIAMLAGLSACGGGNVRGSAGASVGGDGFNHFDHYHGYGYPHHDHVGAGSYGHNHNHSGYSHYGHSHGSQYPYHDHRSQPATAGSYDHADIGTNTPAKPSKPKADVDLKTGIDIGL